MSTGGMFTFRTSVACAVMAFIFDSPCDAFLKIGRRFRCWIVEAAGYCFIAVQAMGAIRSESDWLARSRMVSSIIKGKGRADMFRVVSGVSSEVVAIAFAVYMGFVLFQTPGYMPPIEDAMRASFVFCGICAAYWWLQSGSLALAGATSPVKMAADVLTSVIPIGVVGYAIFDFWRGILPLSDFRQYSAYFALGILLLDVAFNTIIMARLSRRVLDMTS
jgi:hypothetical protein